MLLVRMSRMSLTGVALVGEKQIFGMGLRQSGRVVGVEGGANFLSMRKMKQHFFAKQAEEKTEVRGAAPKPRIYLDSVGSPIDEYKAPTRADFFSTRTFDAFSRVITNMARNLIAAWRSSRSIENFSRRKFKPKAKEIYNDFYTSFSKGDIEHLRQICCDAVFLVCPPSLPLPLLVLLLSSLLFVPIALIFSFSSHRGKKKEVKAKLVGYKHVQGQEIKWTCLKLKVDVQSVRHAAIMGPEFEFVQAQVVFSGNHVCPFFPLISILISISISPPCIQQDLLARKEKRDADQSVMETASRDHQEWGIRPQDRSKAHQRALVLREACFKQGLKVENPGKERDRMIHSDPPHFNPIQSNLLSLLFHCFSVPFVCFSLIYGTESWAVWASALRQTLDGGEDEK